MQDGWTLNWTYYRCGFCQKTQRMWLTEQGSLTCQVCGTVHAPQGKKATKEKTDGQS